MGKVLEFHVKQVASFFGIEIKNLSTWTTTLGNTTGTCNADGVTVTLPKVQEGDKEIKRVVARCLLNAIS